MKRGAMPCYEERGFDAKSNARVKKRYLNARSDAWCKMRVGGERNLKRTLPRVRLQRFSNCLPILSRVKLQQRFSNYLQTIL